MLCRRGIGAYRQLKPTQRALHPGWSTAPIGRFTVHLLDGPRLPVNAGFHLVRFVLLLPGQSAEERIAELLGAHISPV